MMFFHQPGLLEGFLTFFERNAYSSTGPEVPQDLLDSPKSQKRFPEHRSDPKVTSILSQDDPKVSPAENDIDSAERDRRIEFEFWSKAVDWKTVHSTAPVV